MEVDLLTILCVSGQWCRDMMIFNGYPDTSGVLLAPSNLLCFTLVSAGQLSSLLYTAWLQERLIPL